MSKITQINTQEYRSDTDIEPETEKIDHIGDNTTINQIDTQ